MSNAQVFWVCIALVASMPGTSSIARALEKVASGLHEIARAIRATPRSDR